MLELALVCVAGVLGSAHCIGMCGPFALTIGGSSPSWKANATRQLVYTSGRVFTYSVFGAVAGFAGWRLQEYASALTNTAAVLAVLAGCILLYQGLLATGWLRRRIRSTPALPCLGSEFLATFLKSPTMHGTFLAGLFTGMLPCGLVYGFLALAASSSNLLSGAAIMAAFGLGTAPVMILTGCGSSLLSLAWRRSLYRVAAWCVVLTGVASIARGVGFLHIPGWLDSSCPYCS